MSEKQSGIAYSYIRFSSKEQERGDSIRRQTDLRDEWLKRHPDVHLDESLNLNDLGVSAFRGAHRNDKYALGQFLDAVKRGRVARGSILILENLDRLTRQDELEATHLFTGLLLAGVTIVQLHPETIFNRTSGQLEIMRAVIELGRADAESERKSMRVSAAWSERKKAAAKGGAIITRRCPAWLEVVGGRFQFKPGALAAIQRIFAMCCQGRGGKMIAADMNAEAVPHFAGKQHKWDEMYVRKILTSAAVLGVHQSMTGTKDERKPDGAPIKGYYPEAVDEKTWYAAAAALKTRKNHGGARGNNGWVNVFADKLHDARTGERLQVCGRIDTDSGRRYRVLQATGVKRWGGKCIAYPLDAFEEAVLSEVREIDYREILPDNNDGSQAKELAGQLAEVEGRVARLQAALADGGDDVTSAVAALRSLEARKRTLSGELAKARQEVASPLHETWGALKGLVGLAGEGSEVRVRIRSTMGRAIKRIDCLFVPNGECRMAAIQISFSDSDIRRHYVVFHRPARQFKGRKRPAAWSVISAVWPEVRGEIDLGNREDTAVVEKMLAGLDVSKLEATHIVGRGSKCPGRLPTPAARPRRG